MEILGNYALVEQPLDDYYCFSERKKEKERDGTLG